LIAEAVREHLLPGDRADIHRRYAEALAAGADSGSDYEVSGAPAVHRLVRIALHWRGAHEHGKALRAAGEAAERAGSTGRYVEQLSMLEAMLQLWSRVADPAELVGMDRTALLESAAAAACWAADPERGFMLAEAALELLDPDREPERYAAVLMERSSMRLLGLGTGAAQDLEAALELTPPGSRLRRELAGLLARTLLEQGHVESAASWTEELLRDARAAGDERSLLEGRITHLRVRLQHDGSPNAVPPAQEATLEAQRQGDADLAAMASLTLVRAHAWSGDLGAAAGAGRATLTQLRRAGLDHYHGATLAFETAAALLAASRWDDAVDAVEQAASTERAPHHLAHLHIVRAEAALRRGPLEDAATHLDKLAGLLHDAGDFPHLRLHRLRLGTEHAHLTGDVELAGSLVRRILATPGPSRQLWPALCAAARWFTSEGARGLDGRSEMLDLLRGATQDVPRPGPAEEAHAAVFDAERGRAEDRDDPNAWLDVAATWERLERPFDHAVALWRAGGAIATQDRTRAAELLADAAEETEQIEATVLRRQIDALARRIGVHIGQRRPSPAPGSVVDRLTDRELEVLRLVALGMSNGEIASELFISRKTASVHVSNILAKLSASSRTEAVAIAHRERLLEAEPGAGTGAGTSG
jgi:DNA-binding CsgD family transcriptional regulator